MAKVSLLGRDEFVKFYIQNSLNESLSTSAEYLTGQSAEFVDNFLAECYFYDQNSFLGADLNEGLKELWAKVKEKGQSFIEGIKGKIGKYKEVFNEIVDSVTSKLSAADKDAFVAAIEKSKVLDNPSEFLKKVSSEVNESKEESAVVKALGRGLQIIGMPTAVISGITAAVSTDIVNAPQFLHGLTGPLAIAAAVALIIAIAGAVIYSKAGGKDLGEPVA